MLYGTVLSLHLCGAAVTAFFAAYAFARLWQRREDTYSFCAKVLGIVAGFEIGTGTLLSILSPLISALSLCANIALYLSVVLALELLLLVRIKNVPLTVSAISPIACSLLGFASAVAHGF